MTNNHQHNKNTPPQEGTSDEVVMDALEQNQHHHSNSTTTSIAKKSLYYGIAIVVAFVLLKIGLGLDVSTLSLYLGAPIEWTTSYILPWIFLYYFIQFVRAFVKGKQG